MALPAVIAQLALVDVVFLMAIDALLVAELVIAIRMAAAAGNL
jgi:hypothetical protein